MHKRPYDANDRRQDAKKLRALNRQLKDITSSFTSSWEVGDYETAALFSESLKTSAKAVEDMADAMLDWQQHGVLVSYAD